MVNRLFNVQLLLCRKLFVNLIRHFIARSSDAMMHTTDNRYLSIVNTKEEKVPYFLNCVISLVFKNYL